MVCASLGVGARSPVASVVSPGSGTFLQCVACIQVALFCHLDSRVSDEQNLEWALPPLRFPAFPPEVLHHHEVTRLELV